MKKITLIIFSTVFSIYSSYGQFTTMFNDTIQSFGTLNSVCQDDSFYYVIGGLNNSILKIDKQGSIVEKRKFTYSGFYFQAFSYNSVVLNGSSIVSCGQANDTTNKVTGVVVSVDKHSLDTLWFKNYESPDTNGAYQFSENTAIKTTPDGGYIVTGNFHDNSVSKSRSYLMKIDSVGGVEWRRTYNNYYTFFDIEVASDSGYFVPSGLNGTNALQLVKFDSQGVYQWKVGVTSNVNAGYPMSVTIHDDNFAILGFNYLYDISNFLSAVVVAKVDLNTKSLLWEKNYYTFHSFECLTLHQAMGVETLPNGDIIVSGTAIENSMKGVILKLNSNGDSLWTKTYNYSPLNSYDCQLNDLIVCDDGGFMGVGFLSDQGGSGWTAWMFKTDSNGVVGFENPKEKGKSEKLKVWPNPSKDYTTISITQTL